MTLKEKAYELVDKFFMPLPLTSQVLTKVNNITFEYDDWEVAKKCALIAVDEILDSYSKEKSHGYIISDRIIIYWKEVKQEIEKL
jgi:hypothetical protein